MVNKLYNREYVDSIAAKTGFIKDNVEKVLRLIDLLEVINTLPEFVGKLALKGGTAINLCIVDCPRLSVDIDLDCADNLPKDEMTAVRAKLKKNLIDYIQDNGYTLSEKPRGHFALDSLLLSYLATSGNNDEIILSGGRSTQGVVRIAGTVRRPHKSESEFSNSFLSFLQESGFGYSQRYLGRDECGRDIFEYIEGYVPDDIGKTMLNQLCEFMKIVRRFHDLSLRFTRSEKVVCHNDLSPCNTVFVDNMPVAIIDWDSACVGERWEDLTYILWLWINIGSHDRANIDILGQMKAALAAYGADSETRKNFADKLIWRMDKVIAEMAPDNYQYEKTKDWVEFSKLWVEQNREIITKEIG